MKEPAPRCTAPGETNCVLAWIGRHTPLFAREENRNTCWDAGPQKDQAGAGVTLGAAGAGAQHEH